LYRWARALSLPPVSILSTPCSEPYIRVSWGVGAEGEWRS
jgi:hypothetical protein